MVSPLSLYLALFTATQAAQYEFARTTAPALASKVDRAVEQYWRDIDAKPSAPADDTAFLRRLTLDLVGRIPSVGEAKAFAEDRAADKRSRAIRRLTASPEYSLQLGRVLDEIVQGKHAGDTEFLEFLRSSVAARKPWDAYFREIVLGPWDSTERKSANRFLSKRLASLDDLTNDTARVFFGVNVSCAKCHNHPLVADWTQDHYYGMVSFFNRTHEASKDRKKKNAKDNADIPEQATGDVQFVTTKGERRTAKLMFLSSKVVAEPVVKPAAKPEPATVAALFSRREQLVKIALEDRTFFSRSIVNRLWAYFMGQGLVHPVDQMHSANPPAIPSVLEMLADDLADHRYNLDRLVTALVSTRVYQLASIRKGEDDSGERTFTHAQLRSLTPYQLALSAHLATGEEAVAPSDKPRELAKWHRALETKAAPLVRLELLDPRADRFQSSTGEALLMSNHPDIQRLVAPDGKNLVQRMVAAADSGKAVDLAVWSILSRPPQADEREYLVRWLDGRGSDRARLCSQLVWALLASAEFRFIP